MLNKDFRLKSLLKLNWYEEQLSLSKQKRFGTSSEKTDIDQLNFLFDEAEKEADLKIPEPTVEEITYKRKKQVGQREKMLEDLSFEASNMPNAVVDITPEYVNQKLESIATNKDLSAFIL